MSKEKYIKIPLANFIEFVQSYGELNYVEGLIQGEKKMRLRGQTDPSTTSFAQKNAQGNYNIKSHFFVNIDYLPQEVLDVLNREMPKGNIEDRVVTLSCKTKK